jgi:cell division protein FtsZ
VLDEKMGEEVKITVIATGFRDQMPERRARMLSVEEAPVVSVPLVAVPVEEPSAWMSEEPAAPAPPVAPRFKSEEEDEEAEKSEATYFFSSEPAVATSVTVSGGPASLERAFDPEPETVATTAHLEDMEQESAAAREPREYAHDFTEGLNVQPGNIQPVQMQPAQDQAFDAQPTAEPEALFPQTSEAEQRDLDVPAFLRRLQF